MTTSLAMLDVDGTLMHRGEWNPGAPELIHHLASAGMQVALCSGRPTGSLITLAQEMTDVSLIASSSGATAMAAVAAAGRRAAFRQAQGPVGQWEVLGHRTVDPALIIRALAMADQAGIEVWGYNERDWLVRELSEKVRDEETFIGDVPHIDPILGRDDIGKILFILRNEDHLAVAREIGSWEGVGVVLSGEKFADLVPEAATATKGGDFLTDHLGITWGDVLAIGDGENDIGMLSQAGASIAVAPLQATDLPEPEGDQKRASAVDTAHALELVRSWF